MTWTEHAHVEQGGLPSLWGCYRKRGWPPSARTAARFSLLVLTRGIKMPRDVRSYLLRKKADAEDEAVTRQWLEIEDLYSKRLSIRAFSLFETVFA